MKKINYIKTNLNIKIAHHYCTKCEKPANAVDFEGKCKQCAKG